MSMPLFACFQFVDLLSCQSQLGDHQRIGGIAIVGVILRGNIKAIFLSQAVEIILHMQAVGGLGRPGNAIVLPPIMAFQHPAVDRIVPDPCLTQGDEPPAAG